MKYNFYEEILNLRKEYSKKYDIIINFYFLDKFPLEFEGDFSKIKNLFNTAIDFLIKKEDVEIDIALSRLGEQTFVSIHSDAYKIDKKDLDTSFLDKSVEDLDSEFMFSCNMEKGLEFMFVFNHFKVIN